MNMYICAYKNLCECVTIIFVRGDKMKEEKHRNQTLVSMGKTKKSAWDVAKEWQDLGKEKIRKMEYEKGYVS